MNPAQKPTLEEQSSQSNRNEVGTPVECVDVSTSCPDEQSVTQKQDFAYKSLSVGAIALGVLLAFIGGVVSLVSFTLQLAPWDVVWIESNNVSGVLQNILLQTRYEVAVIGLIALNFLLFFLRSERLNTEASLLKYGHCDSPGRWELSDDEVPAFADDHLCELEISLLGDDLDLEMYEQGEIVADVSYLDSDWMDISDFRDNNTDARLQIATDELSRVRREVDVDVGGEIEQDVESKAPMDTGVPEEQHVDSTDSGQDAVVSQNVDDSDVDEAGTQEYGYSVINLKAINIIRGLQRPGKDDLLKKVVGVYFSKTPELIEEMSQALLDKNYTAIGTCAHSLESSSAYLGADNLSVRCRRIEYAVNDACYTDLDVLVTGIRVDYEVASAELGLLIQPKAA